MCRMPHKLEYPVAKCKFDTNPLYDYLLPPGKPGGYVVLEVFVFLGWGSVVLSGVEFESAFRFFDGSSLP